MILGCNQALMPIVILTKSLDRTMMIHTCGVMWVFSERKLERERDGTLRETCVKLDYANEVQPSPLLGRGYLYLLQTRSPSSCGSGIQWVKTRPSSTMLLNLLLTKILRATIY